MFLSVWSNDWKLLGTVHWWCATMLCKFSEVYAKVIIDYSVLVSISLFNPKLGDSRIFWRRPWAWEHVRTTTISEEDLLPQHISVLNTKCNGALLNLGLQNRHRHTMCMSVVQSTGIWDHIALLSVLVYHSLSFFVCISMPPEWFLLLRKWTYRMIWTVMQRNEYMTCDHCL